jgi:hypothetical protein
VFSNTQEAFKFRSIAVVSILVTFQNCVYKRTIQQLKVAVVFFSSSDYIMGLTVVRSSWTVCLTGCATGVEGGAGGTLTTLVFSPSRKFRSKTVSSVAPLAVVNKGGGVNVEGAEEVVYGSLVKVITGAVVYVVVVSVVVAVVVGIVAASEEAERTIAATVPSAYWYVEVGSILAYVG